MKIHRRSFLKMATTLIAFPSSVVSLGTGLCWSTAKCEWGNELITVSKGPYSCTFSNCKGQDLIDCHGLCATQEMLVLVTQEIEYGKDNMVKILRMPWGTEYWENERKKALKNLRRIRLSGNEISEIYHTLKELRGPHDCVLNIHESWKL